MILLGLPNGSGYFPAPTVLSLLHLRKPVPVSMAIIERLRIDEARNKLVKMAIDGDADYLFFIDDDNPVPPDTLEKFLEDDKDIVMAPVLRRGAPYEICCYRKGEVLVEEGKEICDYEFIKGFKEDLEQVDAGGMACVLIKREVFKKVYEDTDGFPFQPMNEVVNGQRRTMGEDVAFCERAKSAGFEIWVDTRVRPVHLGAKQKVVYNPE